MRGVVLQVVTVLVSRAAHCVRFCAHVYVFCYYPVVYINKDLLQCSLFENCPAVHPEDRLLRLVLARQPFALL